MAHLLESPSAGSILRQAFFLECVIDVPGVGNSFPLQYGCLEDPMDRGAWQATIHGVAKSQTRLSMGVPV